MQNITQSALATEFPFGTFMDDFTNRYMSGTKQYSWRHGNENFAIRVYISVYSLELKDQPWSLDIVLKDIQTQDEWRLDSLFYSLEEKAVLGPKVKDLTEEYDQVLDEMRPRNPRLQKGAQREMQNVLSGIYNRIFGAFKTFEPV